MKCEFKLEVGLHHGSALSSLLFVMVMDRLTDEVRQKSLWTITFVDGIAICSEGSEQADRQRAAVVAWINLNTWDQPFKAMDSSQQ